MKKRILILACALALLVGCLVMTSMAATTKTGYCQACKETVTWEPVVYGAVTIPEGQTSVHKHYYCTADTTAAAQIIAKAGAHVCIDLNGKDLTVPGGRAFLAYEATEEAPASISIQDSVGGATVTSLSHKKGVGGYTSNTNNGTGGLLWVANYCTVNIYGGSYTLDNKTPEDSQTTGGGVGIVYSGGTLNLFGGTFKGGTVKTAGGTFDVRGGGILNILGGTIEKGSAGTGDCVYMQSTNSKLTISGDAKVDEVLFANRIPSNFVIDGAFTGKVNLAYNTANVTDLAVGTAIGTLTNSGSVAGADLYCTNGDGFSVVADGAFLKLAAPAADEVRHECEHCGQVVKWERYPNASVAKAGTYHYYLDKNYGTAAAKQFSVKAGAQVCLDLMGHSYDTIGRVCGTSESGTVLSIMDSVGGGKMTAHGGNNNPGGGTVNVGSSSTFNLYSGTLAFAHTPENSGDWGGTGRGGVIQNSGTLNVYGGKIEGGEVVDTTYEFTGIEGAGGAIYSGGTLNIQGGEITMGVAAEVGAGPCIYVTSNVAKVTLGGDAKVADIYFAANVADKFTVDSGFTGTAQLSFEAAVTLHQGLVVGKCAATDWQGTISCNSESFPSAIPAEGNLVLSAYPAGTVAGTGGMGYPSLQAAMDAASEGAIVDLMSSVTGDVSVDKNVTLQLNGCNVAGTVTVAEGKTLSLMDSATTDYTVADGKYGKLTQVVGNVAGAVDGNDNYVIVTEKSGISAHCVTLQIHAMTLRVTTDENQPGLYYKSNFKGDEKAAAQIDTYGVALSVVEAPTAANMGVKGKYTTFTDFESGALGNLGNNSSTLLSGIMKNKNTDAVNGRNLNKPVYGRAYAKTVDGQLLFGQCVCRSLSEQLAGVDGMMDQLSSTQTKAVTDMYAQFRSVLKDKGYQNIATASEKQEKGTLKVLVLGNSHGLDATNLLYEVFHAEREAGNHDQDVVIAALYYSGCNMDQHDNYLTNNLKEYTYHKNDGTQPDRTWVVKDATCLDALQDEQWDIIFMQQMNHRVAIESNYDNSWKVVADYLLNNQDIAPKLGFHMTWTNPDNYELYLDDNAPLNNPNPASWRSTHEKYWSTDGKYDQSKLYQGIVSCVQKYLVNDTSLVGRPYDYILPVATAIEYAQDVCGRPQTEIYRDYTHMNDYGRVITAYTWYATIMGLEEITEVNLDAVPAVLKHKNSKFPAADANGNYTITEDMKADAIESVNWAIKNPFNLPE